MSASDFNQGDIALAIFVKTPGYSPVKSRLAAAIGRDSAEYFYTLSTQALAALAGQVARKLSSLKIYWAVAERECLNLPLWSVFDRIDQGEGGLGERLDHVYKTLRSTHRAVCIIGSDSPHVPLADLLTAIRTVVENSGDTSYVGRCDDGGFWFFGSQCEIARSIWTSVRYSTEFTSEDLIAALRSTCCVDFVTTTFDVDHYDDLVRLGTLAGTSGFLPEQKSVIDWAVRVVTKGVSAHD